jgi:hypothetical protein
MYVCGILESPRVHVTGLQGYAWTQVFSDILVRRSLRRSVSLLHNTTEAPDMLV